MPPNVDDHVRAGLTNDRDRRQKPIARDSSHESMESGSQTRGRLDYVSVVARDVRSYEVPRLHVQAGSPDRDVRTLWFACMRVVSRGLVEPSEEAIR